MHCAFVLILFIILTYFLFCFYFSAIKKKQIRCDKVLEINSYKATAIKRKKKKKRKKAAKCRQPKNSHVKYKGPLYRIKRCLFGAKIEI